METKEVISFGNIYLLTGIEIANFHSLRKFIEEDENFILQLKKEYALDVREDLLILFVQLYFLRYAIPYFQISNGKFPDDSDVLFLRKILYSCLLGRFIDDLIDKDSEMFKTYESILLFQKYTPKLTELLSNGDQIRFDQYLFDSTKYKSPVKEAIIEFNDIKLDVYERIKYFFIHVEKYPFKNQEILKSYTGVLLGSLDVNDLIADGYLKASSTLISNYVYHKFYNEEGKLLFDNKLLNFYHEIELKLMRENKNLIEYCETNKLYYTANILKRLSNESN